MLLNFFFAAHLGYHSLWAKALDLRLLNLTEKLFFVLHFGVGRMVPANRETGMPWFAPAKINWFLEVLGKRPDGYHELVTFMSQISIWDGFTFFHARDGELSLDIDDPSLDSGDGNLVIKAAKALWNQCGRQPGVRIRLYKRIPREAGLGGGSSDAAATLAGLNRFWELGYSREQLVELGAQLGSDVPFFLGGPSALCSGRGEKCQDWPVTRKLWLVLVQPDFGLETKRVYQALKVMGSPQGIDPFLAAWDRGSDEDLGRAIFNRLEIPALELEPEIGEWKLKLRQLGALASMMTGSGSVIFGLFASAREACRAASQIAKGADDSSSGMTAGDFRPRTVRVVHTLAS